MRHFLLAVQFYTRIPLGKRVADWVGFSPAMLRRSAAHFPGVGWVVGAFATAVLIGVHQWWTALVAAVLSTSATAWLTGGFHEDGLADTADGLGGTVGRERALAIMRDSRVGSYGSLALTLALLAKAALLTELLDQGNYRAAVAVVVAHVLSRFAPLLVMAWLDYVGAEGGRAKPMADQISRAGLLAAAAWTMPALALAGTSFGPDSLVLVAGVGLPLLWMVRLLRSRLQGYTGDTLGATQQVVELGVYLALAALR